jgi:hypothetical protein
MPEIIYQSKEMGYGIDRNLLLLLGTVHFGLFLCETYSGEKQEKSHDREPCNECYLGFRTHIYLLGGAFPQSRCHEDCSFSATRPWRLFVMIIPFCSVGIDRRI